MNFLNCGVNELTNTTEDESFYGQWPCYGEIALFTGSRGFANTATKAKTAIRISPKVVITTRFTIDACFF